MGVGGGGGGRGGLDAAWRRIRNVRKPKPFSAPTRDIKAPRLTAPTRCAPNSGPGGMWGRVAGHPRGAGTCVLQQQIDVLVVAAAERCPEVVAAGSTARCGSPLPGGHCGSGKTTCKGPSAQTPAARVSRGVRATHAHMHTSAHAAEKPQSTARGGSSSGAKRAPCPTLCPKHRSVFTLLALRFHLRVSTVPALWCRSKCVTAAGAKPSRSLSRGRGCSSAPTFAAG